MAGSDDDILPPPPPPLPQTQTLTQQAPHTVLTIKLPILKKGEYDIWAMKMEHYLAHTDYPIWEVIQRGNGHVSVSTDTNGVIKVLPPKTAKEILARERERKARTTLLMALPEDHLAKFHKMTDAKEMWEAIKSRFGGNDESKKMQKYILKQQFEGFSVSNSEGLHKGYDRFQSLLSQLEIHGAGVSTEDANQKFLRSLPSAWSQVSLIMRTKPGVDSLSFDDLYNNLRVFESDVKGSTASSSSTQNVAFVSENTSSTNDVSTAYGVSNSSGHNSQCEHPSSYSFLANQSSCPQLDHEDLEQLDEFDLEEIDLKWQVAMISMRMKKFYKKNRSKRNQDSRRRDAWNTRNKDKDNGRRSGKQEESKSLVTLDGEGVDWTSHSEDEQENYALMACSNSGSDTEAITQALKKVEAQFIAHQQSQLWYEEKIRFMKIDLDDKTDMGVKDKAGLGYGDQMNKGVLSYKNEVFQSVFVSRMSETENSHVNDRYAEGMHAVPPPMTGIYIPSGPDKEIDDSQFSYGPKQSKPSESDARSSDFNSCESNCSEETHESMPEPVVNEPKVVSEPKVWSDAPIIEEYESDSEDEHVSLPTKEQEIPSFADKHVKTPRQTVIEQNTCSQSSKPDKKDCSGLMSKKLGLGFGYTRKACFVCGSFSHLIRDCDFHEKKMAKQAELNNRMSKGSSQREIRPVWDNVQRMNHQNQFVPKAVLTRTGNIPVNTARHNFNRQAVPINAARKVNTVKPILVLLREKRKLLLSPQQAVIGDPKDITGTKSPNTMVDQDYPHRALQNKGIVDSGCSRHMTGNKAYLTEYQDFNGGTVSFGGSKGYITSKGKIKTGKLDFEDVCFVKELQHFNFFSVLQICDKKNKVLFIDSECLVLSLEFKLPDENQVLLRIPRQNNMYSFNLENIVPYDHLNTIDHLGKFDGKSDEGFLVGYSLQSKAFRVYNLETKRVEENLHITFLENKPNVAGKGPTWLFDLDYLTDSMNYQPVRSENQANKHAGPQEANHNAGTKDNIDAGDSEKEDESAQDYFVLPIWSSYSSTSRDQHKKDQDANNAAEALRKEFAQETKDLLLQAGAAKTSSTNIVNNVSTPVSTASPYGGLTFTDLTNPDQDDSEIPALEEIYDNPTDGIFTNSSYDDEGAVADFTNLDLFEVTDQAKETKHLKAQIPRSSIKKPNLLYTPQSLDEECILEAKIGMKESLKSNWMQKESVSKQGRKSAKAEPSVHKDPLFEDFLKIHGYMETEDAQDVGRTKSTAQQKVSTDKEKVSTDRPNVSTDRPKEKEGTPTLQQPTPSMFEELKPLLKVLPQHESSKAVSKRKGNGANGNFRAFNYLMEILHIFDRQDLYHLYNLMMEQYSEITLEGIELILWGDLKIMMESSTEGNDQSDSGMINKIGRLSPWRLYESL
ncbi:putative ribonuclease H-like domain-containing protein [Tanacetum coccineum]